MSFIYNFKKIIIMVILSSIIVLLMTAGISGCNLIFKSTETTTTETVPETASSIEAPATNTEFETTISQNQQQIIYTNTQYGFSFSLPDSWEGYSLITSEWEGNGLFAIIFSSLLFISFQFTMFQNASMNFTLSFL